MCRASHVGHDTVVVLGIEGDDISIWEMLIALNGETPTAD
jgi:hypothetical protein